MDVRTMRAGHLGVVAALAEQLGYPVSEGELNARLAAIEGHADHRVVVVVEAMRVVGWAHVCLVDGLESPRFAEIRALVVDAAARRSGAGRALVEEAKRWAREREVKRLRVRSNVQREEAHRFYPALGFRLEKTQACYGLEL